MMECDKYKIKAVTHQQQGGNQEANQEANPPTTPCKVPEIYISGMAQKDICQLCNSRNPTLQQILTGCKRTFHKASTDGTMTSSCESWQKL